MRGLQKGPRARIDRATKNPTTERFEAMPIYEYECQSCGHVLDALQKISDDPLKHCPDCGEPSLKKLLSAPRFRLKGSGWYETDFKDKNRRNIASSDATKADGGKNDGGKKKGDDKKSEPKPEKKAASTGKSADT
jgi:putative FmdB family regulatory protein